MTTTILIADDEESIRTILSRAMEGRGYATLRASTGDIALDFSAGEGLVGIEILRASRLFDTPESPKIDLKNLIPRIVQA